MVWEKLQKDKVPNWVRKNSKPYLKGKTFLYKRIDGEWYRKFRSEWVSPIPLWQYILVGFVSTLLAGIIVAFVIYGFGL